jgi:predicted MFS family arabinose efflux permease
MVDYINYTNANITSFAGGYDYAASVLTTGTGIHSADLFSMLVLFGIFMVFTGISMKYNSDRAILYGSFMSCVACALMVSGNMLNPIWAAIPFGIFLISLFIWGAKS